MSLSLLQPIGQVGDDVVLLVERILSYYHAPCLAKVQLDDPEGEAAVKACRSPVEEQWAAAESTTPDLKHQKATALDAAVFKAERDHVEWWVCGGAYGSG